jgi:GT2 family glycosyltransferase
MARVAIVVVTHESGDVIGACLNSVLNLPEVEIVVVDNASSDRTLEEVDRRTAGNLKRVANSHNCGFAGGVNIGVRATSADLILLMNPDVNLKTGLESLVACFDDQTIGGAGGLLIGSDGSPQKGFMARSLPTPAALVFEVLGLNRLWPGNPVNWHYRCLGNNFLAKCRVDQPAGAFFMFRRDVWSQLGGFDERFWPVWFEDVDFCARIRAAGFSLCFQPSAGALHQGGHSVRKIPEEIREKYWYGSLLKYAAKHYHPVAFGIICVSVAAGAVGRAVLWLPRGGWKIVKVYGSVIRLSFAHLLGLQRDT